AGLFAAHSFAGSFGMLLALTLAASLATAPLIPLGEAMGLRAATRYGFAYAPVRAAGSLSFLAAALGTGWLLDHVSPAILPWLLAVSLLATAMLGWTHPGGGAPLNLADRAPAGAWRDLLRHPAFLIFALATALGQGAHAVYYAFSVLIWQEAGLDAVTIGALWATGVAAEIWLMFGPGRSWLARLGPVRALALAALAGILRWGAMALGAEGWVLWPLQAMHALTFGLTHLAAMAFIAEAVPMRLAGTAQGLAAGLIGGSVMAGLILAAGQMAGEAAAPALYLLGAIAAAASFGAALLLGKLWRGGAIA
ncbi:MAG: MFS transporter, partial [Pseudomonadota bacterium]